MSRSAASREEFLTEQLERQTENAGLLLLKLQRIKEDYLSLSRWAGQQNAGNAFATQVRMHADSMIAQWDLPLEEWEP